MKYVAATIVFLALIGFWKARQLWKSASAEASEDEESDEEIERRFEVERTTIEVAPWFGTTGLPEEDERELPRYLRREFGEFLIDGDALRAADLTYLGVQADREGLRDWPIGGRFRIRRAAKPMPTHASISTSMAMRRGSNGVTGSHRVSHLDSLPVYWPRASLARPKMASAETPAHQ